MGNYNKTMADREEKESSNEWAEQKLAELAERRRGLDKAAEEIEQGRELKTELYADLFSVDKEEAKKIKAFHERICQAGESVYQELQFLTPESDPSDISGRAAPLEVRSLDFLTLSVRAGADIKQLKSRFEKIIKQSGRYPTLK